MTKAFITMLLAIEKYTEAIRMSKSKELKKLWS